MNQKFAKFARTLFIVLMILFILFSIPMATVSIYAFLFTAICALGCFLIASTIKKKYIHPAKALPQKNIINNNLINTKDNFLHSNINLGEFVVLDFETTGLSPKNDFIIQIGAIKFNNTNITNTFSSYVKPPICIPYNITKITGIDNNIVSNSPTIDKICPQLIEFIGKCDIVCHNAPFDISFLNNNLSKLNLPLINNNIYDTLTMSKKCILDIENHKLETIKEYLSLNFSSHDALEDCKTTAHLYSYCVNKGVKYNSNLKQSSEEQIEKKVLQQPLNEKEEDFFNTIINFFKDKNLDTALINYIRTGVYFDICYDCFKMIRLKINGSLQYYLYESTLNDIVNKYPNLNCQNGSKSEAKHIRIFINSSKELLELGELLINDYNEASKHYKNYLKYKDSPKPTVYKINIKIP